MASEEGGATEVEFFSTRLTPEDERAPAEVFPVFLVQVKSDSEIGRQMLVDPLSVLRERVSDMGIAEGFRAQLLRVNAEVPANPVHRSEIWIVYPGLTAIGIQYKHPSVTQA